MSNKTELELGQKLYTADFFYGRDPSIQEHIVTGIFYQRGTDVKYFEIDYSKVNVSFLILKKHYFFSRQKAERVLAQKAIQYANWAKRSERNKKLFDAFDKEQAEFMKTLIKKEVFVYGGKNEQGVAQWIRTWIDATIIKQNHKTGKCFVYISARLGSGWYKLSREGTNWKWYTEETNLLLEKEKLERALGVLTKKLEDAKLKSNKGE